MPPQASFRNSPKLPPGALRGSRVRRTGLGFSLMEMLVVLAIMAMLIMFLAPSVTSLTTRGDFSGALYKIAGKLQEAHTYAVANNTHVFVGIEEVDASKSESASPQTPASASAGGRVAVAAYASRDGTSVYDVYALDNWIANYGTGSALTPLGKGLAFANLHLANFGTPPGTGAMARTQATADYNLGNSECASATPLAYPPGASLTKGYKYSFSKVIAFDPQGTARIISAKNTDAVPNVIEIALQPTHGSAIPAAPANQNTGNHAVIQINGATGNTRIYQP